MTTRQMKGVSEVYPRVCGGTSLDVALTLNCPGLSPRVRGNQRAPPPKAVGQRSIPACAGEPAWMLARCWPH